MTSFWQLYCWDIWVFSSQKFASQCGRWASLIHLPPHTRHISIQYFLHAVALSKSDISQVGCRCPGGGGQNKPTTAPAEERCDSGRQAAAVLSAKMAAHSAYRHRAQLRGGGLPLPTICLKCGSSLGRLTSLCVELIKEMPSPLLATG